MLLHVSDEEIDQFSVWTCYQETKGELSNISAVEVYFLSVELANPSYCRNVWVCCMYEEGGVFSVG